MNLNSFSIPFSELNLKKKKKSIANHSAVQ
jgi:hypothetical protein